MGALSALSDHNQRFNRIERRLDAGFDRIDDRFTQMESRFNHIDDRFTHIDDRFTHIDDKFDRKFDHLNDKLDRRFSWQTAIMAAATMLILAADPLRDALGF